MAVTPRFVTLGLSCVCLCASQKKTHKKTHTLLHISAQDGGDEAFDLGFLHKLNAHRRRLVKWLLPEVDLFYFIMFFLRTCSWTRLALRDPKIDQGRVAIVQWNEVHKSGLRTFHVRERQTFSRLRVTVLVSGVTVCWLSGPATCHRLFFFFFPIVFENLGPVSNLSPVIRVFTRRLSSYRCSSRSAATSGASPARRRPSYRSVPAP